MKDVIQLESHPNEDLPSPAKDIALVGGFAHPAPSPYLPGEERRGGLEPALVEADVKAIIPEAVKDQALGRDIEVTSEVEAVAFELHRPCHLAEPLALAERRLVEA